MGTTALNFVDLGLGSAALLLFVGFVGVPAVHHVLGLPSMMASATELGWVAPIAEGTAALLRAVSSWIMVAALIGGAVILIGALVGGMRDQGREGQRA